MLSKSTAMVMSTWSVHLTTIFPRQAVNQYFVHILSLVIDNSPSCTSGRGRMDLEIIS